MTLFFDQIFTVNIIHPLNMFFFTFLIATFLWKWIKNRSTKLPPGPVGLPFLGYLPFLGSNPKKTLLKLSEKYGNIFGLYLGQKYTIIINEYTLAKETLSHTSALDRPPELFYHLEPVGLVSANGKEWTEQRRFTMASTKDFGLGKGQWEIIIMDATRNLIKDLHALQGAATDITHMLCDSLNSNVISLITGRKLDKVKDADTILLIRDYAETALSYVAPQKVTSIFNWSWKLLQFMQVAGYDRASAVIKKFHNFINGEITRHKMQIELKDVPDLINVYQQKMIEISSKSDKHYFTEENLKGLLNALFLGGSDSVLSFLNWSFRLMADRQDIQQKVYNEITEVLGKDEKASYDQRHIIPYTFAVLLETQRFASVVPLDTTRRASEDFVIDGYTIPKGADIVVNLWALHNDEKYWKEPEKFCPERFLDDDGGSLIKILPSFAPFSLGRRNCPGERIAWIEILAYFTEIIKNFRVTTAPGEKTNFEVTQSLVDHLKPQTLCFTERPTE